MAARRKLITFVLSLAIALGLSTTVGSQAASASGPSLTKSTPFFACPGRSSYCQTNIVGSVSSGTAVTMSCWQDAVWTDNMTHRWFYVTASGNREGFVHAGDVNPQTNTPNCLTSSRKEIWATNWALSLYGNTSYDNLCQTYVHDAYKKTSGLDIGSWPNPATFWANETAYARHGSSDPRWKVPPRGAIVVWGARTGYPDGHAAISLGDGWIVSTYERTYHGVHLTTIGARNASDPTINAAYKGWVLP